jgi:pimeloyl-ACP methyl ester carboxylesterase
MPRFALPEAELYFEETGAGPPLVLLHGLGGSGEDWAPLVPAFARRFRILVPDARGSGRTVDRAHPRGPFTLAQLADDVVALLEHLGATPAHLVGWSMGGMVALQLAVQAPQLVRSLVVINSGPDWTPKSSLQRVALSLRGVVTALVGPRAMARVLAPRLFPGPAQAAVRAAYLERMGRNDPRAYAALLAAIVGWSVADRLAALTMPTLVVSSERDYLGLATQEAWARQLPDARLVRVPDAGHALPLEAPGRLAAVLEAFLPTA